MSSINWQGTIPFEDTPFEIEFDEFGVASSTMHFQFEFESPEQAAMKIANILVHPHFAWLKRTRATINREEACFGKATVIFDGVPPSTDQKTYRLKGSLATEPIMTHPKFQEWADEGLVEVAEDGKSFIWTDQFTSAALDDDSLVGIESYLSPNLVYEEVWVRGNSGGARDFSKLGRKMNPPASNAKPGNIGSGRNFLFVGGNIELIGFGSKMTRQWRLSGRRGWNERIYK